MIDHAGILSDSCRLISSRKVSYVKRAELGPIFIECFVVEVGELLCGKISHHHPLHVDLWKPGLEIEGRRTGNITEVYNARSQQHSHKNWDPAKSANSQALGAEFRSRRIDELLSPTCHVLCFVYQLYPLINWLLDKGEIIMLVC